MSRRTPPRSKPASKPPWKPQPTTGGRDGQPRPWRSKIDSLPPEQREAARKANDELLRRARISTSAPGLVTWPEQT